MTTPRKIIWKINLKNGAGIDLPLQEGDAVDEQFKVWMDSLKTGSEFFYATLNDMEAWINSEQLALASRIIVKQPPEVRRKETVVEGDFTRVD